MGGGLEAVVGSWGQHGVLGGNDGVWRQQEGSWQRWGPAVGAGGVLGGGGDPEVVGESLGRGGIKKEI